MVTGATNGTRVKKITIRALTTTTAGMIRFFANDGSGWRLWMEFQSWLVTVSAHCGRLGLPAFIAGRECFGSACWIFFGVATQNGTAFSYVVEAERINEHGFHLPSPKPGRLVRYRRPNGRREHASSGVGMCNPGIVTNSSGMIYNNFNFQNGLQTMGSITSHRLFCLDRTSANRPPRHSWLRVLR